MKIHPEPMMHPRKPRPRRTEGLAVKAAGADNELHRLLGLAGEEFQTVYHFAVGRAITDPRISATPAYPNRSRNEAGPEPIRAGARLWD